MERFMKGKERKEGRMEGRNKEKGKRKGRKILGGSSVKTQGSSKIWQQEVQIVFSCIYLKYGCHSQTL